MKAQDIVFFVVFIILLVFKRDGKLFAAFGLFSILASIPFFALWIFFTAQRLVWYAVAFLSVSILLNVSWLRKK